MVGCCLGTLLWCKCLSRLLAYLYNLSYKLVAHRGAHVQAHLPALIWVQVAAAEPSQRHLDKRFPWAVQLRHLDTADADLKKQL